MHAISPKTTHIAWVGTGVMGLFMCRRILDQGYSVQIFSRTRERAQPLVDAGASWADSAQQAAAGAQVVFSMTGFPSETRSVLLGAGGALNSLAPESFLVDMATGPPSLAREIADKAAAQGVFAIDAPVSGGDVGAKNGTLSIMTGGDAQAVAAMEPLFRSLGSTVVHQGPPGSGQHTKMVNQILIAGNMVGVCEALVYADASGLNLERVMESVSSGAAGSWSLSNLGRRMMNGDYAPGFYVEHFIKDLGIALDEAEQMKLKLPGLELAKKLYDAAQEQGHGKSGTQALIHAVAALSLRTWKP